MSRESIILPNKKIIDSGGEVYYRKLSEKESHALAIKEFSEKYHLGITFESLGLPENVFHGTAWYYRIVALGQVFLRIETTIIVYLPETMSLNQIEWLNSHKNFFVQIRENLALVVLDKSENVIVTKSPSKENKSAVFKLMYKIIKEQGIQMQNEESEELKR